MGLREYFKKRNFSKTPEPKGHVVPKSKAIFTIQKHAASHLHYDFRLAIAGVLKSWAVPKGPCLDPSVKRLAVEVEDHPLSYAQFEGAIPEGQYGGGTVIVWDYGTWESEQDLSRAYQAGSMLFTLHGQKLSGAWKLLKTKNQGSKPQWLLIKIKDNFSRKLSEEDIVDNDRSVLSGKNLEEIAKKKENFKPELATLVKEPPSGTQWLSEVKYDGYRILAFIEHDNVRLMSRNNQDWTQKFSSVAKALKALKLKDSILDGEVVALDKEGHSNFQLLQNSMKEEKANELHYFIFDMPFYQGKDLSNIPLVERKSLLRSLFKKQYEQIHYSEHAQGDSQKVFKEACKKGLEGIVAKRADSIYQQIRTEDWLKVKCIQRQEFLIVGYTHPKGERQFFGSLLLGYYDKGRLIDGGHVGTGFTQKSLSQIHEKLAKLSQPKTALDREPAWAIKKNATWVKPILIAEVEFTEWTEEGYLRHPSFKGLREDKSSKEISRESFKVVNLSITHPDKMLYPEAGITKLDIAHYYTKVADRLLAHIKERPLTLVRCPVSMQSQCFYQKHWAEGLPESISSTPVEEKSTQKKACYIVINNKKALMDIAQLAVLELHPWSSLVKNLSKPNRLIFDLDPAPDVSWVNLLSGAIILRDSLHSLGFKSYPKLTGGKGIHVVVPIRATQDFESVKSFCKNLAEALAVNFPQLFTANLSKKSRAQKIFIDYLRNEYAATAVAPFSPRVNKEAAIAVPVSWEYLLSLDKLKKYTIKTWETYLKDFQNDPWIDFFLIKQALTREHFKALESIKT